MLAVDAIVGSSIIIFGYYCILETKYSLRKNRKKRMFSDSWVTGTPGKPGKSNMVIQFINLFTTTQSSCPHTGVPQI